MTATRWATAVCLPAAFLLSYRGSAAEGMELRKDAFFVAPNGDDRNPGTFVKPWRTIGHAAKKVTPGVTVYVRGGVYDEQVDIARSGAPGKYIVFENFPGERPVIDRGFKGQYGFRVAGSSYVKIRGFEIRNCKGDPKDPYSMAALVVCSGGPHAVPHHCLLEGNYIHCIIGGGKAARGIAVLNARDITVQNNTVYHIVGHTESMGILCSGVTNAAVRRNLVYFCDKEGIRLITHDTDTENIVEGNIALHCHMGISLNNCRTSRTIIVRNNFCGWNYGRGINPKHTRNVVLTHNTVYANQEWGIDVHGSGTVKSDNYYTTVTGNIMSFNRCAWWILDSQTFHEKVDWNFYQYQPGSLVAKFNWGEAGTCRSIREIRHKTRNVTSVSGPYEMHAREGDPGFVSPMRGDFRLMPGSPAKGAAEDGEDMGALETELAGVGADKKYGLGNIPDLGELRLTVEAFSSDTAGGRAKNVVDGSRRTYWEINVDTDPVREIVLDLPGARPVELAWLTLVKFGGKDTYFYKRFELFVGGAPGGWKPVPEPLEHPFRGYKGLYNGETWRIPEGTLARKVKVRFVSGYGKVIRVPEIRIYGRKVAR